MEIWSIAFRNNVAPLPWHLRVNLDVEDTSALIHPCQRKGLIFLERCYKEHRISSEVLMGDTWDVNRHHRTKILVDRPWYSSKD